jgi:predicted aspartyl protease
MKPTRFFLWLNLSGCLLLASPAFAQNTTAAREGPQQATVPLLVEKNRPYVDLTFRRPDGSKRSARFLVDSGGGGFLLTETLARDLGLKWGATMREDGSEFAQVTETLKAYLGDFAIELDPQRVMVVIGAETILPKAVTTPHDGMLPGHVLAKYHVVFDYPKAKFTIARAGVLKPKGTALPMPVHPGSGFPRTEIEVDGKTYGLLLDTGASFTMVSEVLLKFLGEAHPDWPRHPGAYGEAATLGGMTLETMFIPSGRWGAQQLTEFGVVSQRKGTFESYMSKMMTAPIVGSLAGNVLKRFRVDLDYPNAKLYLSGP